MNPRHFLLAALLLSASCSASKRPAPAEMPATIYVGGTAEERVRYERHRDAWAAYFKRPAPYVSKVTFYATATLQKPSGRYYGWASGTEIELAAGAHWSFHEICHVAFVDYDHQLPDWAAWDAHQQSIR